MTANKPKLLLIALLLNALTFSSAWAERILIDDADQTVILTRALDCFSAADIRINASRPDIYEPFSRQLQSLSDATLTILRHQCPGLSKINITGSIRGLDDIVYQGQLSAQDSWLVRPDPTVLSLKKYDEEIAPEQAKWTDSRYVPDSHKPPLSVTNLRLGMSIEEVSEIVSDTFHTQAEYSAYEGKMTMLAGGCPEDFDANRSLNKAQTEWKCLRAWFSDKSTPQLLRLELVQVTNADAEQVQQLLVEKYGPPQHFQTSRYDRNIQLFWRANKAAGISHQPVESLSAELLKTRTDLVVTSLTLFNQESEGELLSLANAGLKL